MWFSCYWHCTQCTAVRHTRWQQKSTLIGKLLSKLITSKFSCMFPLWDWKPCRLEEYLWSLTKLCMRVCAIVYNVEQIFDAELCLKLLLYYYLYWASPGCLVFWLLTKHPVFLHGYLQCWIHCRYSIMHALSELFMWSNCFAGNVYFYLPCN